LTPQGRKSKHCNIISRHPTQQRFGLFSICQNIEKAVALPKASNGSHFTSLAFRTINPAFDPFSDCGGPKPDWPPLIFTH
jgi:hypothetical protein